MDQFPDLYKLSSRKNRKVKDELQNLNGTRGLWRMTTVEELAQFVQLWDLAQQVTLTSESDTISWRWTADGKYTSKSAYEVQFVGSYSTFNSKHIWKGSAEGRQQILRLDLGAKQVVNSR